MTAVLVAAFGFSVVLVVVDLWVRLPRRRPIVPATGEGPFCFPPGFLWGTATSDHQIERASPDDWLAFERRARAEKKQERVRKGQMRAGHIAEIADVPEEWIYQKTNFDAWYAEDLARAKELGTNAFRFSVSWARLFPRAGMTAPDPEGIAFYHRVFDEIGKNGIVPFVTLFHFASPQWLWEEPDEHGARGLLRRDAVDAFALFTRTVVDHFGKNVKHWCTLNEPMVWAVLGYMEGVFPPHERHGHPRDIVPVTAQLLRMHAAAYHVIKASRPDAEVGIAHHVRDFMPWRNHAPLDGITAHFVDRAFVLDFLDAIETGRFSPVFTGANLEIPGLRGTQDYVGINYYGRFYVKAQAPGRFEILPHDPNEPGEEENDVGWAVEESGFAPQLVRFARRYGKPLFILENGIADAADDDAMRQRFLVRHAQALWQAIAQGAPVRGYFYWSLIDNFEWVEGFGPRFGLYAVDYAAGGKRTPRPSAAVYADIARHNAISAALWRRYRRPPPGPAGNGGADGVGSRS